MVTIETEQMSDFFTKYHLRGLPFDAVLHKFTAPDKGDPHDHPFAFTTHILKGGYIEDVYHIYPEDKVRGPYNSRTERVFREPNTVHKVKAIDIHKIIDLPYGECWTLMIPEAWERKSGFWRMEGNKIYFRHWDEKEFTEISTLR